MLRPVYKPLRPDLVIQNLRGTSTPRGYHETFFEIVTRVDLDDSDIGRLSDCGLLGMGQAYNLEKKESFEEDTPCVLVDDYTGEVSDKPAMNYAGKPITNLTKYKYFRYTIRRICDSGD